MTTARQVSENDLYSIFNFNKIVSICKTCSDLIMSVLAADFSDVKASNVIKKLFVSLIKL